MDKVVNKYEAVIGLEIHVQLDTKSKMFCRCDNNSESSEPNTNVCPVCMGYPGVLPVMNEQAIDWGIKTALALGCTINPLQRFDRKNYFYPDLPKAYQISQFFYPVGERGNLQVDFLASDRKTKREFSVGITRLHLEEDAGKLIHEKDATLVDLNRCGTPLAEIVTEPDIKSPEEARAFMQELQRLVRSLGVSKADMEKGHLRVDANVSVRPIGQEAFGTKVEVKNMNSFKFMEQALKFEIDRQIKRLEQGERIIQETRGWDEKTNTTVSQRSKEGSVDYRYFPEPDLPPIYVGKEKIEETSATLPPMPSSLRLKAEEFGLPYARVSELQDLGGLRLFVELLDSHNDLDPILLMNWLPRWIVVGESMGHELKNSANPPIPHTEMFTKESLVHFIRTIGEKKLSSSKAQSIYDAMTKTGKSIDELVSSLKTVDSGELEGIVKAVINDNPEMVAKIKAGDNRVVGFLMGQIMAKSKGEAEPAIAKEILERLLTE